MAAQKVEKFIDDLNQFHQHQYKPIEALFKVVRSADTGILALDRIFKTATVTTSGFDSNGYALLNEVDITTIVELLRGADIVELNERMKSNINVPANDITLLREAVGFTPQRALFDLERKIKTNYQKYEHLNATVESHDSLSESAKKQILCIENYLIEKMPDTTINLTIGSVTVKPGWILDATKRRSGCQMLTTIQEKTTSCKIIEFSCNESVINNNANDNCSASNNLYNTTLITMYIAELPDDNPLKIDLVKSVTSVGISLSMNDLKTKLLTVIERYGYIINPYIDALKTKPQFNICTIKNDQIENGKIPFCRMCDPMARAIFTKYIDSTMYNNNITFKCVQNPSIIDVITDASLTTGINLLYAIVTCNQPQLGPVPIYQSTQIDKSPKKNVVNYLLIFIGIVIVILLILSILFFRRNRNKKSSKSYRK